MAEKLTIEQFGSQVKSKYPDYAKFSDLEIGQRMLQKYPVYADRVQAIKPEESKGFTRKAAEFLAPSLTRTLTKDIKGGEHVTGRDIIGSALEIGSFVLPVGAVAKGIGLGARALGLAGKAAPVVSKFAVPVAQKAGATLGKRVLQTGAEGAFSGALQQAGGAIGEGAGAGETLKRTGIGAIGGGVIGGALPVAGAGISKVAGGITKPKVTRISEAIDALEDKYLDIERGWVSTRKASDKAARVTQFKNKSGTTGRTPERVLSENGIIPEIEGTKFNTKSQADKLRTQVEPLHRANKAALAEAQLSTEPVLIDGLEKEAVNRINSSSNTPLQKESMLTKARAEFDALRRQYGNSIKLDDLDNIKSSHWGATKFDTAIPQLDRDIHYAIAKSMQESIEETAMRAGAEDVAQLNREIGDILEGAKFLERLDGRAVLYGRMGTHMTRLAGAVVGSKAGPLGGIIGMAGGDLFAQIMRNNSVATPVKRLLLRNLQKENPAAYIKTMNWLEKQGLARELRLALPSPKPLGTAENPIIMPAPTTYEPMAKNVFGVGQSQGNLPSIKTVPTSQIAIPRNIKPISPTIPERSAKVKGSVFGKKKELKGKPQQAFGVVAGIEPQKDEEGKFKGFGFNPTKAAIGFGLTSAFMGGKGIPKMKNLTTKFLSYIDEKLAKNPNATLSKQEILDFAKRPELKKGEADLLMKKLEEFEPKGIKAYHGSPIEGLSEIGFGKGVRSNPFMGTSREVESNAIFFTPDKKVAKLFADNRVDWLKDSGKSGKATVYERYLDIKNPADLTNVKKVDEVLERAGISAEREITGIEPNYGLGETFEDLVAGGHAELGDVFRLFDDKKIVEKLKKAGFDGAIVKEKKDLGTSYVIFNPKQALKADTSKLPAQDFADSIRRDLLELKPVKVKEPQYKNTTVDKDVRYETNAQRIERGAMGKNYEEVVFESPITTNGSSHFPNSKNYFAHARGDEVVEGGKKIWREQEIQSDLLQKEGMERFQQEAGFTRTGGRTRGDRDYNAALEAEQLAGVDKLSPFTNDRFGERIMRERIKEKASKGYEKYRLPTGETIGKIEGFENREWRELYEDSINPASGISRPSGSRKLKPENLEVGQRVAPTDNETDQWIITDILGDGRFKAVPKDSIKTEFAWKSGNRRDEFIKIAEDQYYHPTQSETFDLTGKSNPQYRRYSDWGKFLKNKFGGKEITDPQGNNWIEIDLKPEYKKMPIEAFSVGAMTLGGDTEEETIDETDKNISEQLGMPLDQFQKELKELGKENLSYKEVVEVINDIETIKDKELAIRLAKYYFKS